MNKRATKVFCCIMFVLVMLQGSYITAFAADDVSSATEQSEAVQLGTESVEICTSSKLGLRVISFINQAYLKELQSKGKVEYGTVAIAATVLEKQSGVEDTLLQIGQSYQYSNKTYKVTKIPATQDWKKKDGKVYFTGVLTGISGAGFNTRYAVRAYAKVGGEVYYGNIVKESGYTAAQKMVASSSVTTAEKNSVISQVVDACDTKKSGAYEAVKEVSSTCEINDDELPRNYGKVVVSSNTPEDAVVTLENVRIKDLEIKNGANCTIKVQGNTIIDNVKAEGAKTATVALRSARAVATDLKLEFGENSWLNKLVASTSMSISKSGTCCLCIPTLEVADSVKLDVDVAVDKIIVDEAAQGSMLTLNGSVDEVNLSAGVTITGNGDVNSVDVVKPVDNLVIESDLGELTITEEASNSNITVNGTVEKAVIEGENSTIKGSGDIKEAEGNANNDITVDCPPLDRIASVEALDATHIQLTMENGDTKLSKDNVSLKKGNDTVEIKNVTTKDNKVYTVETASELENKAQYTLCIKVHTLEDEKTFECSYAVPQITSLEPVVMSNKLRGVRVTFKDVDDKYLVSENVEIRDEGNELVSKASSFMLSSGKYVANFVNTSLPEGTYKFVLKMDTKSLEKEFTYTVPFSISSVTTEGKNSIKVTLNKATAEQLDVSAFTVTTSGQSVDIKSVESTDKKSYTLTLTNNLTDGATYAVSVTPTQGGEAISKSVTYMLPLEIESVEVQDSKTVIVTMTKQTSFIMVQILKGSSPLSSTYKADGNKLTISMTDPLESGTYSVSLLTTTYSNLTKDFTYEAKEPENEIEAVNLISVTWESKLEVKLKNATTKKLTKSDMCILCGGGREMTIVSVDSSDNKTYNVTTGVFLPSSGNNEYTFSIITEPGKAPIQKTFIYDIDMPHDSEVEVIRTEDNTAELSMSVDQDSYLYWYVPNLETSSSGAGTQPVALTAASEYDFDFIKAKATAQGTKSGAQEDAFVGLNRFAISGLNAGQTYTVYYALESKEHSNKHTDVRSLTIGSEVKTDPHKNSEYTIEFVEESPRNVITVMLNKAYPGYEHMTLGNFAFICPKGAPLTTKGGSLQKLEDGKKFIVTLPMNYFHKTNTYNAKVTFNDGTYAEKSFRSDTEPPKITSTEIKRTGTQQLTVTFTSNKAGKVYMGTYTFDANESPTPLADDVISGNVQGVHSQDMVVGTNTFKFDYNGTDKHVFAVYVSANGYYNVVADKLYGNIPDNIETEPEPQPEDPNAPKIVSVTQEYDDYYVGGWGNGSGYFLNVKFDKSIADYYIPESSYGEIVVTSYSQNAVPNTNQMYCNANSSSDGYEISFESGFEKLNPGNYKIQITLTNAEDESKISTVSYDFTVE